MKWSFTYEFQTMEEQQKSRPIRTQDVVNAYVRQEQSVHSGEEESPTPPETATGGAGEQLEMSIPVDQRLTELEQQLEALVKERDQLREQYMRSLAEMENLRRRMQREKEQIALVATEKLFARLVELLDDLHAAVEAGRQSRDYDAMFNGLELISAKAHKLYEEHGVRPLEAKQGEPFNVELHEALIHVPHRELPEGTVIEQVQRGYLFRDRVLRHARVITSAGATAADGSSDPSTNDTPSSS